MKKVVSILLMLALVASLSVAAFAAGETGTVSVSTVEANPGETVTVEVAIDTNPGVCALQIKVNYDETALVLDEMTASGINGGVWTVEKWALWDNTADSTYTGTVLTLTFTVKEGAEIGSYAVSVDVAAVNYDEEDVAFTATAGAVKVDCDHVWGEWTVVTPATCTTVGEEKRVCTLDADHVETREIPMLDHTWGAYEHDENGHWRTCEVCGTVSEVEAHKYNGKGYCVCGYKDPDFEDLDDQPDTGDITSVIACAVLAMASLTGTGITVLKRKK